MTALELVGYPQHAGGLNNVATVLEELCQEIDRDQLVEAAMLSPIGWSQRLGYLLELTDAAELREALAAFVNENANSYIPLRRSEGIAGARRDARWKAS